MQRRKRFGASSKGDGPLFVSETAHWMVDDAELDALFVTVPSSFVASRDALARKALEAGQHERASQIHALRKPTMVVWLINQLARRHPDEVTTLTTAGRQLKEAQLKGLGSTSLQEANKAWRVATTAALRRIRKIAERGIDEPRIVATLTGAVADPVKASLLARGCLADELRPPDVEGVLGELAKASPSSRRSTTDQEASRITSNAMDGAERQQRREAAKQLREREREAAKALKEAARAEEIAGHLERRAKTAADEAATARKAAEEAARRAKELAVDLQRQR